MHIGRSGKLLENFIASELDNTVNSFSRYLRNIIGLLSPIIDKAYFLQAELGNIYKGKVKTSDSGLWSTQVCIDASTTVINTENDCTYTVISVTKKVNGLGIKVKKYDHFMLMFNERKN